MSSEKINQPVNESEKVSLKELIIKISEISRYLVSKWVIILTFCVIGAVCGFLYAKFKKPLYTSTTTFVLEEEKSGGVGLGSLTGLASMAGVDLGGGGGGIFQGDNILELYKSRNMIQKALLSSMLINGKKELLVDYYIDFNDLRTKWKDKPELLNLRFSLIYDSAKKEGFTRLQDSVLGDITNEINRNNLIVSKLDKKLSIIRADVVSSDELFAKVFNEEIVNNVNEFYIQTKTKKSTFNVSILQQKVDSVRGVMNGAIYSAATIADATPNLNVTRQVQRTAPMQKSQFSAETNKAILGELVKNLELSKITLRKETPLIQVIDEPIFPLQKTKITSFKGITLGALLFCFFSVIILTTKYIVCSVIKDDLK